MLICTLSIAVGHSLQVLLCCKYTVSLLSIGPLIDVSIFFSIYLQFPFEKYILAKEKEKKEMVGKIALNSNNEQSMAALYQQTWNIQNTPLQTTLVSPINSFIFILWKLSLISPGRLLMIKMTEEPAGTEFTGKTLSN